MALGKKTGGRQKGSRNRATAEVKALALQYSAEAIRELAKLGRKAKSEQARVAAWREVLDRGVGKPAQTVDLTNTDGSLSQAWAAARAEMEQEAAVTH